MICPSPTRLSDDNGFSRIGSCNSGDLALHEFPCASRVCASSEEGMAIGSTIVACGAKSWVGSKCVDGVNCDNATTEHAAESCACSGKSSRNNRNGSRTIIIDPLVANVDGINHIQIGARLTEDLLNCACNVNCWVVDTSEDFHATLSSLSRDNVNLIAGGAIDPDNAIAYHCVEILGNGAGRFALTDVIEDVIADAKARELVIVSVAALLAVISAWCGTRGNVDIEISTGGGSLSHWWSLNCGCS